MKLITVPDRKGKTIYDTFISLKETRKLQNENLIAVSIDGASSMPGSENGFVTFLKNDLPNLIGTHCIAHRRSEERRVGKECPVLCRSRWSPYH